MTTSIFGESCPKCNSSVTMVTSTKFVDGKPVEHCWTCADCTRQWIKKIKQEEDQDQ
ncbi:MAG: hypothetical protein HZR80_21050 [Candidatus Heimdallarchaeota archaeon]